MDKWLSMALATYLVGAIIEGISAAKQLSHSYFASSDQDGNSEPTDQSVAGWKVFTAIAMVSICGGFSWPCRLIHRSLKGDKLQED